MKIIATLILSLLFAFTAFAADDAYRDKINGINAPVRKAVTVTTSDTVDLDSVPRALWIGGDGDVAVIMADDTASVVLKNASGLVPVMVKRVLATGTTATYIVALY